MNTCVFGMDDSPSMWYFPRALLGGEGQLYVTGDIRLPSTKVRKVMSCMNMIIGVWIEGWTRRNMLWDCLSHIVSQCMTSYAHDSTQLWNWIILRKIATMRVVHAEHPRRTPREALRTSWTSRGGPGRNFSEISSSLCVARAITEMRRFMSALQGDLANVENKHTQMYYYIRVSFSCVFPIS
jgi:hypothetical protein